MGEAVRTFVPFRLRRTDPGPRWPSGRARWGVSVVSDAVSSLARSPWVEVVGGPLGLRPMSKKTKKRKARLRRSKANHGKRPNMGRG